MMPIQKPAKFYYDSSVAQRLWARDATLWSNDQRHIDTIQRRLGWLDSPQWLRQKLDDLYQRIYRIQVHDWKQIVLIGMGGSSLAPAIFSRMATASPIGISYRKLKVLDSTHPDVIRNILAKGDITETLFVVSSKSGVTLEVMTLCSYVHDLLRQKIIKTKQTGNFVAITDEGTPLEGFARENEFLDCFINPADVGGRFSALTYYGMVPAALLGFDLHQISKSAEREAAECRTKPNEYNKAFDFGWHIASHAVHGRNKLTLMLSPEIEPIGAWIEQLLAESTGKDGRGILPIVNEAVFHPGRYGTDRIFVAISLNNDSNLTEECRKLELAGFPVFSSGMRDLNDVGGQFFRWEFVTAIVGAVLSINPFDEPDVQRTKNATNFFLEGKKSLKNSGLKPCIRESGLTLIADPYKFKGLSDIGAGITRLFGAVGEVDYVAILSWLEEDEEARELLENISSQIQKSLGLPATVNFGPRYLHSTGQFHKGGLDSGVFIQIVAEVQTDLSIPDREYGFRVLHQAQADADLAVLSDLGRRVVRIDLGVNSMRGLADLTMLFDRVLSG